MGTFGNACIVRSGGLSIQTYTWIDLNNPNSEYGIVTTICMYVNPASMTAKVKIFRPNGSNYDFVGESGFQTLVYGANTFAGLNISVQPGDLVGLFATGNGTIYNDTVVGGLKLHAGDITGTTPQSEWTTWDYQMSLLATCSVSAIYINSSTGNDSNTGDSCTSGHPVKTFQKAYDLLAPDGTIHVCDSGADFSGETVTFTKGFSITVDGDGNCYLPKLS